MNPARLLALLERVASGDVGVDDALEELRTLPFAEVESALVDCHREIRTGIPEVVFGEGKTVQQVLDVVHSLRSAGHGALVTRLAPLAADELLAALPEGRYDAAARVLRVGGPLPPPVPGARIAVVSAGTADRPVAAEAAATLEFLGIEPVRVEDVGVAGLHRLLANLSRIRGASAAIVVAGMEGALPSVVGGLVDFPVIAVPTSVGYGASFEGLAALLAMMNSCAAGVTVVNIDNGFGAAVAGAMVLRAAARAGG